MQNSLHFHCFREYLELDTIECTSQTTNGHIRTLTKCFKLNTDATKHQNMMRQFSCEQLVSFVCSWKQQHIFNSFVNVYCKYCFKVNISIGVKLFKYLSQIYMLIVY